jgi:hypothetical protein
LHGIVKITFVYLFMVVGIVLLDHWGNIVWIPILTQMKLMVMCPVMVLFHSELVVFLLL